MPASREVSERVRAHLHELDEQVAPGVAEEVALAMVSGAAEAFRELTGARDGEATRKLLGALQLDSQTLIATFAH